MFHVEQLWIVVLLEEIFRSFPLCAATSDFLVTFSFTNEGYNGSFSGNYSGGNPFAADEGFLAGRNLASLLQVFGPLAPNANHVPLVHITEVISNLFRCLLKSSTWG
jgi:hypothetical protein